MGYFKEETIKMSLICTIQLIADKLKVYMEFDDLDKMTYTDLTSCRDELLMEYNQKIETKKQKELKREQRKSSKQS